MGIYKEYIKDENLVERLEQLQKKKESLKELLDDTKNVEPYVVELAGLPRTGKSITVERLTDFFKFGKINVVRTTEPAQLVKDSHTPEELEKMTKLDFNNETLRISRSELSRLKSNPANTVILQDRGVIDNYFWYQMMYEDGTLNDAQFKDIIKSLPIDLKTMDKLYVMISDPHEIIKRDYLNAIYLEPRKKTTIEGVTKLKNGMEQVLSNVQDERIVRLDTTSITDIDTSIIIADDIMDGMFQKIYQR